MYSLKKNNLIVIFLLMFGIGIYICMLFLTTNSNKQDIKIVEKKSESVIDIQKAKSISNDIYKILTLGRRTEGKNVDKSFNYELPVFGGDVRINEINKTDIFSFGYINNDSVEKYEGRFARINKTEPKSTLTFLCQVPVTKVVFDKETYNEISYPVIYICTYSPEYLYWDSLEFSSDNKTSFVYCPENPLDIKRRTSSVDSTTVFEGGFFIPCLSSLHSLEALIGDNPKVKLIRNKVIVASFDLSHDMVISVINALKLNYKIRELFNVTGKFRLY